MAVHGDFIEITYNHPTIGSGVLFPKANESNTIDLGGFRNNDDASQVTSAGQLMIQKNRVVGFFEVTVENDHNVRNDLQRIVDLSGAAAQAEWTVQLINGAVYAGTGVPVGDLQVDTNTGTFTLKVASGLGFQKISG